MGRRLLGVETVPWYAAHPDSLRWLEVMEYWPQGQFLGRERAARTYRAGPRYTPTRGVERGAGTQSGSRRKRPPAAAGSTPGNRPGALESA